MISVKKFSVQDAPLYLNGGLMGAVVTQGVFGLVGKTVTFANPPFSHTFVAGSGVDPDTLRAAEVKSQLETASGGKLVVSNRGGRLAFIEATPSTGVAMSADVEPAKQLLGLAPSVAGTTERPYAITQDLSNTLICLFGGSSGVEADVGYWRDLVLEDAGELVGGFAALPEGPCSGVEADADCYLYAQPRDRARLVLVSPITWTLGGADWDDTGDVFTHLAGAATVLSQDTSVENPSDPVLVGKPHLVIYTIEDWVAGGVTVALGTAAGTKRSAAGVWAEVLTPAVTGDIGFTPEAAFDGVIDPKKVWVLPLSPKLLAGQAKAIACSYIGGVAAAAAKTVLVNTIVVTSLWHKVG